MTVNKRSKNTRQRGSQTHGYGSMKKHRGAGSRGGRGNAGSGKRADTKKPSLGWTKGVKQKGKIGFYSVLRKDIKPVTIHYIETHIDLFQAENGIIDLNKYGYQKLLSNGKIKSKLQIKVNFYSAKAKEKIEAAGGKIIGNDSVVEKKPDEKKE